MSRKNRCLSRREARPLASLGQHVQIQNDMPPRNSQHLQGDAGTRYPQVMPWKQPLPGRYVWWMSGDVWWFMGGSWVVHGWIMGGSWVDHGWIMGGSAFQSPRIIITEATPNFHQRKAMARGPGLSNAGHCFLSRKFTALLPYCLTQKSAMFKCFSIWEQPNSSYIQAIQLHLQCEAWLVKNRAVPI